MSDDSVPPFGEWYAAIHADRETEHRTPFPWQARLAESIDAGGCWPSTIKVPTGLGKTACLDIAVWAVARQADRPPSDRTARTRIWWVVNRRLLVDDTYRHAQALHQMLRDAEPGTAVGRMAAALRRIAGSEDAEPLEVCRLRGGEPRTRPSLPSQPAIICSTVPMYGSRLLFRGYATSQSMLPVDAALAGTDSLVLLDEAHLANGLRHLIGRVNSIQSAASARISARPLDILPVAITATADTGDASGAFDIDDTDEQHPEVSKRLNAPKHLSLYAGKGWDAKPAASDPARDEPSAGDSERLRTAKIAEDVVAATKALLDQLDATPAPSVWGPRAVLVFVNSPRTAAQVHKGLEALPDTEARVLTGMTRGFEAAAIAEDVRAWMAPGRSATDGALPTATRIVVATQTLEVGADLDADHMVTESCGVQSLVQRLGRLNRMGDRNDSRVCFVHDPDSKERPIYGTAPADIWERFKRASQPANSTRKGIEGTTLDLSPATLRDSALAVLPRVSPAEPLDYAVLHDAALRDLAQTSCPTHEPPAEVFFEGTQEPNREVSLIWRAYVPDRRNQRDDDQAERLWPPQSADEALSVPVWAARQTLRRLGSSDRGRLFRVEPDRTLSPVTWRDGEAVLRPGQTLVLPASAGMMSEHGMLDPDDRAPVVDAAIARAESGLPLDKDAIVRLCGYSTQQQLPDDVAAALAGLDILFDPDGLDDYTDADIDERVNALVEALRELASGDADEALTTAGPAAFRRRQNLAATIQRLTHRDRTGNWTRENPAVGTPRILPNTPRRVNASDRIDDHDDFSVGLANEPLTQHSDRTADMAQRTANQLGLEPGVADLVRLAAVSHDAGKADSRFQRWLGEGERPSEVLGKSATPRHEWNTYRRRSGWPRGGRHEELSRRLVQQYLRACPRNDGLEDLLLHLVVSHHGHGRPLLLGVADDEHPTSRVRWSIEGVDCQADAALSTTDWDQPSRFHALCDAWGYWGLALLEAILRQSDHTVSSPEPAAGRAVS